MASFTQSGPGLMYATMNPRASFTTNFNKWYNEAHIPDVFKAGHVRSSTRYQVVDSCSKSTDRPFLTLYPIGDVQHLASKEFNSIPQHHELLPGPQPLWEYMDLEVKYGTHLGTKANQACEETPEYVVAILFDVAGNDDAEAVGQLLESGKIPLQKEAARVSVWKFFSAYEDAQNLSKEDDPSYLAVVEFDKEVDLADVNGDGLDVKSVLEYRKLKSFGDRVSYFAQS